MTAPRWTLGGPGGPARPSHFFGGSPPPPPGDSNTFPGTVLSPPAYPLGILPAVISSLSNVSIYHRQPCFRGVDSPRDNGRPSSPRVVLFTLTPRFFSGGCRPEAACQWRRNERGTGVSRGRFTSKLIKWLQYALYSRCLSWLLVLPRLVDQSRAIGYHYLRPLRQGWRLPSAVCPPIRRPVLPAPVQIRRLSLPYPSTLLTRRRLGIPGVPVPGSSVTLSFRMTSTLPGRLPLMPFLRATAQIRTRMSRWYIIQLNGEHCAQSQSYCPRRASRYQTRRDRETENWRRRSVPAEEVRRGELGTTEDCTRPRNSRNTRDGYIHWQTNVVGRKWQVQADFRLSICPLVALFAPWPL